MIYCRSSLWGEGTPTKEIKCFILEIATFNWVCWQTANTSMKYHYGGISSGSALFFLNCIKVIRKSTFVCMYVCMYNMNIPDFSNFDVCM